MHICCRLYTVAHYTFVINVIILCIQTDRAKQNLQYKDRNECREHEKERQAERAV